MTIFKMFAAFFAFCVALTSARVLSVGEEVARENLRKLSLANNELAFNLHRRLASRSSDNVFFSPLSISTVFGMLFYGTRGKTSQELREALGYEKAELPNDRVHDTFKYFLRKILRNKDSSTGYVLNTANAVLVDKDLGLIEEYRNNVQELYRAVVRDVEFSREAPRIVEKINDWVREKTNGKIEKLLDELSPSTILVLLNAVYFKGTWKVEFDREETWDQIFFNHGLESEGRRVPMMHMTEQLPFAIFENFQALELPYKGENVSMLILLPNQRNGLASIEQNLTPEVLAEVQRQLKKKEVDVSLPKFKLEFEDELSEDVRALGANGIFSGGSADFSGMTHRRGVSVSEVLHKAVIEVNEEGSEAAAITGIISNRMGNIDGSPEFTADHPFLFAIIEKGSRSNMILFLGRVNKL